MMVQLPHGNTSLVMNVSTGGLAAISARAHRNQRRRFCDPHTRWWHLLAASILLTSFHPEPAEARTQAEVGRADRADASLRTLQPDALDGSHRVKRKQRKAASPEIASIDDSGFTVHSSPDDDDDDATPQFDKQNRAQELPEPGSHHISRYVNSNMGDRDICLVAGGFVSGIVVTALFFILASGMWTQEHSSTHMDGTAMLASTDASTAASDTKNTPTPVFEDPEYHESLDSFWPRTLVLIIMLMVQSLSSYILYLFRSLIVEHPEIIYFLTMLVGLGGNASGQSMVLSVRELAFGRDVQLKRQVLTGIGMGCVLAPIAYGRAYLSDTGAITVAIVIGISVLFITTAGTIVGTVLPKIFEQLEIDPGHTSPVVQVLMDMVGITIVCTTGFIVLDLAQGKNSLA